MRRHLRRCVGRPASVLPAVLLALLLGACRGDGPSQPARPSSGGEDSAQAALPAPLGMPGEGVTGMPADPGPGPVGALASSPPPVEDIPVDEFGHLLPPDTIADAPAGLDDAFDPGVAVLGEAAPPAAADGVPILPPASGDPVPDVDTEAAEASPRAPGPLPASPAPGSPQPPVVPPGPAPQEAAAVVREYYAAIGSGAFGRAYALWADGGRASGQSPQSFAEGFADTVGIAVQVGSPGPVEGAAGTRHVTVPVAVVAGQREGGERRFEGRLTLRRSVVDGASAEQRAWRIVSAQLHETP